MTPCPNCQDDVVGHFAAFDSTVVCGVSGCNCTDWKYPSTENTACPASDDNGPCRYADKDHEEPHESNETLMLRRREEIKQQMRRLK